jgi:hypothetical protein
MKVPESGADPLTKKEIQDENPYIINPYHEKENLTTIEALDCINILSGVLLADGCYKGNEENKRYI